MSDKIFTYKKHNSTSLLVHGDRETHQKFIKSINGRWNSKIKNSDPGWLVPIENEKVLKEYISKLNIIKSRKSQNKYHRAISVSSSDDDEDSLDSDDSGVEMKDKKETKEMKETKEIKKSSSLSSIDKDILNKKQEERNKFEKEKEDFEKSNKKEHLDNHVSYYKSFNNKPTNFKKINNYVLPESEDERYSSSNRSSSSSDDDFPTPKTPKKRKKYRQKDDSRNDNYEDLFKEMKNMQRQIYQLEIENKNLKSKR